MIRLCGLWTNSTKDGKKFMSGKLSYSSKVLIFKNEKKRDEKDPDYFLYVDQAEQSNGDSKAKAEGEGDLPW